MTTSGLYLARPFWGPFIMVTRFWSSDTKSISRRWSHDVVKRGFVETKDGRKREYPKRLNSAWVILTDYIQLRGQLGLTRIRKPSQSFMNRMKTFKLGFFSGTLRKPYSIDYFNARNPESATLKIELIESTCRVYRLKRRTVAYVQRSFEWPPV